MRMGGHAHHDDMLYLGKGAAVRGTTRRSPPGAYADRDAYAYWTKKDPIAAYARAARSGGLIAQDDLDSFKKERRAWSRPKRARSSMRRGQRRRDAGVGVFAGRTCRA